MEKKFDIIFILRVAAVLLIISAIVGLMLSAVNLMTKDKIAENAQKRVDQSVSLIFGDGVTTKTVDAEFEEPVSAVYEVYGEDGNLMGYAVYTLPVGFKGEIEMMVGVTLGGRCKSVEIVDLSETPGLGTKVKGSDFLDQYKNTAGELVLKEDIMPVAGATVSSRAVNDGVNAALEAVGGINK